MNMPKRERRDWGLIIFIIPIGIFLIVIVGQLAIGLFPNWRINADMGSNLDPNSAPGQPASLLQPLLPQILTPMAWAESYLTPGADISFPPFFVIEPTSTASPSPTPVSPTPTTATPTASATPSATVVVTSTSTTPPPPDLCEDPSANNFGDPLPCTYPPLTCQDNTALNFGGPLPCVYPPLTCQDNTALNFGGPLPCVYPTPTGYPSTPDPSYTLVAPPQNLEVGATPNGTIGFIADGGYVVVNLSIVVGSTPDGNYDLVYYERINGGYVYLDWIIIGISNDPNGSSYYEVFNWGQNNSPDTNSNVDTNVITTDPACVAPDPEVPECDNHRTEVSELYDPDGAGPAPQSGILIDVDNADSEPPPGTYDYVVIIAPTGGSTGEDVEIDSISATEIPLPTP